MEKTNSTDLTHDLIYKQQTLQNFTNESIYLLIKNVKADYKCHHLNT
jgi:hypothetical protein